MAYKAEIEIGVKGVKKFDRFQSQLERLSNEVDRVNKKKFTIANLSSYNEALRKANETLSQTEIETNKAGKATGLYKKNLDSFVTALLASNDAQDLNNKLVKEEIQNRGAATQALKAYNAAAASAREVGSMTGAYLRPGEAGLKGQTSPLSEIKKGQRQFQAANNANIKSLERQLEIEQKIANVRSNRIARERSASIRGSSGTQRQGPLAGPGSMGFPVALPGLSSAESKGLQIAKQKLQIINRTVQSRKALAGLAVNLQNLDRNAKVAIADANRETQKTVELEKEILKLRERANRVRATGKSKAADNKKASRARMESLQLGVGFPLLFGAGPGAVAGGGLGALLGGGGGFGGQIIGSAIGQSLDEAVKKVAAIGQAVEDIDATALQEALGSVNTDLARQVNLLNSIGEKEQARAILLAEVTRQTGLANSSSQDINNAVKILQQGWTEIVNTVSGLVGIIAAPLAVALGVILSGVAFVVKGINLILTKIGALIKFVGEFIIGKENAEKLAKALGEVGEQIDENALKLAKQQDEYQVGVARLKRSRQESNVLLRRELEIMKMTSQEDKVKRATAEALLKVDQQRLAVLQAQREFKKAQNENDFGAQLSALKTIGESSDNLRRAEVEAEIAVEAERVYNFYTDQADALQGIVHQSKMRLSQETAIADARNKLTGAYYNAELKVNKLAIQRMRQRVQLYGLDQDRAALLELELRQVDLIYQQTLAQIRAAVDQVRLKAREVYLATKIAEADFLRKKAKGQITKEDIQALKAQYEVLKVANNNVKVQEKIAEQQIKGAKATRTASRESLKFADSQERAARSARRTARAMGKAARSASAASRALGSFPQIGSTGNLALNKLVTSRFGQERGKVGYSSGAFQMQSEGMRRLAMKDAFYRYKDEAAELRSVGISPGPNPYRGYSTGRKPSFAEGGFVTRPTNALIGERGENEYVIPESKMNSAINRYARGQRGESVVEGGGETSASSRGRSGAVVSINTGPVMQMDGQNYVTVADLNDAVGSVAAAMSSGSEVYGGSTRLS